MMPLDPTAAHPLHIVASGDVTPDKALAFNARVDAAVATLEYLLRREGLSIFEWKLTESTRTFITSREDLSENIVEVRLTATRAGFEDLNVRALKVPYHGSLDRLDGILMMIDSMISSACASLTEKRAKMQAAIASTSKVADEESPAESTTDKPGRILSMGLDSTIPDRDTLAQDYANANIHDKYGFATGLADAAYEYADAMIRRAATIPDDVKAIQAGATVADAVDLTDSAVKPPSRNWAGEAENALSDYQIALEGLVAPVALWGESTLATVKRLAKERDATAAQHLSDYETMVGIMSTIRRKNESPIDVVVRLAGDAGCALEVASNPKYRPDPWGFLVESGLLFEINRTVLHPLGMAIAVRAQPAEEWPCSFYGLWWVKDDPEGITFGAEGLAEGNAKLAAYMASEGTARHEARAAAIGGVVEGASVAVHAASATVPPLTPSFDWAPVTCGDRWCTATLDGLATKGMIYSVRGGETWHGRAHGLALETDHPVVSTEAQAMAWVQALLTVKLVELMMEREATKIAPKSGAANLDNAVDADVCIYCESRDCEHWFNAIKAANAAGAEAIDAGALVRAHCLRGNRIAAGYIRGVLSTYENDRAAGIRKLAQFADHLDETALDPVLTMFDAGRVAPGHCVLPASARIKQS